MAEPRPPRACHCAADFQPAVGRGFARADLPPDAIDEDFGPAAGQRAQARLLQPFEHVAHRQPGERGDVVDLRRAEAVDVDLRETPLDVAEQFLVPLDLQIGVHSALQQNLVAAQGDGLLDLPVQLVRAK